MATPIKKHDPNDLRNYILRSSMQHLEEKFGKISTDLSKVNFHLFTPESGPTSPWEFKAGVDPKELLHRHFDPNRPTKFISHGWNSGGVGHSRPFVEGKIPTISL